MMDKELSAARKARWNKAFATTNGSSSSELLGGALLEAPPLENANVATNRKATIVIEHLIQASDVAHTMQHWHVYRKWNERLFRELYKAFKAGRAETDPSSENWYKGEIGFFDFYIIPLAKKLDNCGVFGVSSDEYLHHAMTNNRKEWYVVAEMVEGLSSSCSSTDDEQAQENGFKIEGLSVVQEE